MKTWCRRDGQGQSPVVGKRLDFQGSGQPVLSSLQTGLGNGPISSSEEADLGYVMGPEFCLFQMEWRRGHPLLLRTGRTIMVEFWLSQVMFLEAFGGPGIVFCSVD